LSKLVDKVMTSSCLVNENVCLHLSHSLVLFLPTVRIA